MEKNQGKTLTNNPTKITKLIKIGHFILILIMTLMAGLYIVNLMLGMADTYSAVSDPCQACESITGYKCEKPIGDIFCVGKDCIKINLTG